MALDPTHDLLNDTEPVLVHGEVDEVFEDRIENKVNLFFLQAEEYLLKDVRAVRIESQVDDVHLDAFPQFGLFLRHVYHLNQTLHRVSAFLVARYLQDVRPQGYQDLVALGGARALEEALAEIVTVLVDHEVVHFVQALIDCEVHKLRGGLGEHLLELLATVLLSGKLCNVASHVVPNLMVLGLYQFCFFL
jgi:hypothetical protein